MVISDNTLPQEILFPLSWQLSAGGAYMVLFTMYAVKFRHISVRLLSFSACKGCKANVRLFRKGPRSDRGMISAIHRRAFLAGWRRASLCAPKGAMSLEDQLRKAGLKVQVRLEAA